MEQPKRPLSSYMMWFNAERTNLIAEHPHLNQTKIKNLLKRVWKSLDKTAWKQKAAVEWEEYKRQRDAYDMMSGYHLQQNLPMQKPKKCLSAYILWLNEERNNIKAEHPDLNWVEIGKLAGKLWQSVDKTPWEEKSLVATKEYYRQMEEYNKNYDPKLEQDNLIKPPERPLSAYMMWFKEEGMAQHPNLKLSDTVTGEIWGSIDRTPWEQKAADAKKKYKMQMKALYLKTNAVQTRRQKKEILQKNSRPRRNNKLK